MSWNSDVKTVVVAVDDTPEGYAAARLAGAWLDRDASVVAVHVADPDDVDATKGTPPVGSTATGGYPVAPLGDLHERLTDDPGGTLEVARRAARVARGRSETLTGDPAEVILAVARDVDADLIVMGAHQRNALGRLFSSDTTGDVVAGAPCPVLVAGPAST